VDAVGQYDDALLEDLQRKIDSKREQLKAKA
jgi:hypothetical protein